MGPARFLNGLNITGDLTVTGNILPGANNTYDIGSTSLTWKAGYFKKMSINGADMASSTYVLDVGGTSHFESNAQFDADITVDGISNLKGNTIIGTATSGSNKTLTVNGHVIINPSYNTNNSYSEGLRINKDSNNWSVIALGGAIGTETGTSSAVWLIGANGSNNFYISNSGSDSSANRFQGTPTTGFRMYASASTSALQTGTLTLGSTTSAYDGSGAGGDVALEFWRGKNASWQIINHGGVLQFKNNYSNAAQSTYNQFALDLGYGGNDSIMYTNFKPYTGSSTATQSTLTLGLSTANWDTIFTKTLKFAYDSTDQYLTHAGVAELINHNGKITLYRLLPSGTNGSATSGNNLRPGVMLDAATGFISLEAPNSAPSATAGARIKFDFYDSSSSNNQPVFISHVVSDSYRPPYGLTVWGSTGTKPYAWFEVEGSIYLGAKNDISSETNIDIKRLATSLYIGYKKSGNVFISKAAVSGYDNWLRLNDLGDFTNGVYTPSMVQTNTGFIYTNGDTADPTTYYFKTYNNGTNTFTEVFTDRTVISGKTSIGSDGDMASNDFPVYVSDKTLFKNSIHVYGTSALTASGAGNAYSGGMYHAGHNSIVLHGDDAGSSGILFMSTKGTGNTNINSPSDRAFIQYHPYGVTTATAEGTAPTLATSGEAGRFVIGIGNDTTDYLVLQSPSVDGLKHQVGTTTYTVATLNETIATANYPIVTTTTNGLVTHNSSIVMNGNAITVSGANSSIAVTGTNASLSVDGVISADSFVGTYIVAQIIRW